ncbi:hypothetical protein IV203_024147 [Nitzschia inconspicua]|uniref:SET domain-containing protein n=1 Tax=Nitzschia inconspicua TaxID=303405 RepID=A0A9K3PD11_9STRA|nr:hypothetical protein IV203_024147 [Nitzschia inconspicua]
MLSGLTSTPLVRKLPSIFFLTAGVFHVYQHFAFLLQAASGGNDLLSIETYAATDPYVTNSLLRNMENKNLTSKNTRHTSIGEPKRHRVSVKDKFRSKRLALDEAWGDSISRMLGCPDVSDDGIISDDPNAYNYIPTIETWNALYRAYHATVDPDNKFLTATEYQNSWKVPIEVKYRRPEGRGVYAKEFIPKGTLVWSSTSRNTAIFESSHDRREFIKYLIEDPKTRHLACDAQMWFDVIRSSDKTFYICQTFDEAVLLNTVSGEKSHDQINIEPQSMSLSTDNPDYDENDCYGNDHYFTLRDIQAGEQFRIKY